MDVQCRCRRLARQFAQTMDKLLLELVGEVVLGTEEHDTALADFDNGWCWVFKATGRWVGERRENLLVIARSRRRVSASGAFRRSSTMLAVGNSRPITGVTSSESNLSKEPLCFKGCGYAEFPFDLEPPLRIGMLSAMEPILSRTR